jgi:glutathione S-transferase
MLMVECVEVEVTMAVQYVSVEEAMQRRGLRMVVVSGVPSLWTEAAKGILHVKSIDWVAVRLVYDSPLLTQWMGQRSGPVAMYDDERPIGGWSEILQLAQRLAPEPSLLPRDAAERALAFGLAHEICGQGGLGWSRRLQLVHSGLQTKNGFPEPVAKYLSRKYGYSATAGVGAGARVAELLRMLGARLEAQRERGSAYYIGDRLTAVDIYSAAAVAMFQPLPHDQCAMDPTIRAAFEWCDAETRAALDPILIAHRDAIYAKHLALPLSL